MASYQNQGLQKQCRLESTIIIPKEKEAILPVLDSLAEGPLDALPREYPLPIHALPLPLPSPLWPPSLVAVGNPESWPSHIIYAFTWTFNPRAYCPSPLFVPSRSTPPGPCLARTRNGINHQPWTMFPLRQVPGREGRWLWFTSHSAPLTCVIGREMPKDWG